MPRDLTPEFIAQLESGTVIPAVLLELNFESTILRLWNGIGDLTYDGDLYLGNGWFQGFDSIKEEGDLVPKGINVTLTGVPSGLVSLVLSQSVENQVGKVFLGFLDASYQIIQDPFVVYEGNLDVPELVEDSENPVITISIEHSLLDLDRQRANRYTQQHQRTFFPSDLGFEYVDSIQTWDGRWGERKDPTKKRKRKKRRGKRRGGRG